MGLPKGAQAYDQSITRDWCLSLYSSLLFRQGLAALIQAFFNLLQVFNSGGKHIPAGHAFEHQTRGYMELSKNKRQNIKQS
jgi:hypothetical protein